jgi:T-complex protein 1 subunit beta
MNVLSQNAHEERGEEARLSSFTGAIAVGDLVKSTLGPKGMDKILQTAQGSIQVTNDGATILSCIGIDNPAAKILVDISKVQDAEVGDGTTSVCVLAAELLRESEKLVNQKIHPQTIISGFRKALEVARTALTSSATDNGADPEKFREDLLNLACTTLSSKILVHNKLYFANLAVDAVVRLKGSTALDHIKIIKISGGTLADSYLAKGFILDKSIGTNQPKRMEKAKIMVANSPMDTDKIKIFGSRVRVESTAKVAEIEAAEKDKMKDKVDKILSSGCNVFINRQLVYDWPQALFANAGVMVIEHADFDNTERLSLVTGAEICSAFDEAPSIKLGQCDLVEEIMIGEEQFIQFSGCAAGEACTVVLRGATKQILDEAERSLHDALCVLSQTVKETRTLLGGGCTEMSMATAVDDLAKKTPGKEALAIEGFARALRALPTAIADNAGLDSAELVSQLRAAHVSGNKTAGIDFKTGTIGDMSALKITESFKVKHSMVCAAGEAAEMILRVDDILHSAPRERAQGHQH